MNDVVRRHRPILLALCGLAAGLFVVGAVWVGTQIYQTTQATRETQVNNHTLLTTIAALSHQINDCTKPTGECFKDGQRRTAGAITSIQRQSIATAACQVVLSQQPHVGTARDLFEQINQCAADTLAQLDRRPLGR